MGSVEVTEPRPDLDLPGRPRRVGESSRANSRAALIDAALEEFSTKGYEAATVARRRAARDREPDREHDGRVRRAGRSADGGVAPLDRAGSNRWRHE
jgi:hypothetical protein